MTQQVEYLLCFRLLAACAYDEEVVWAFVQRHGGFLSIRADCIDFWLHERYALLVTIAWPGLLRIPALDYVA